MPHDDLDIRPLLESASLRTPVWADPAVRSLVRPLLNHVEQLATENRELRQENQRLCDEILRLKGEHPAPKRSVPKPPAADHSSEKERRTPRQWKKSRRPPIRIDRTQSVRLDRSALPPDARSKGYVKTIVQELVLVRRNVCFLREKFYSPSTGRTYVAPLPAGYEGGYGPGLKMIALGLCYGANVSFAQVGQFVRNSDIQISTGRVASLLTRGHGIFEHETDEVLRAGLASSSAHGIDTTPTNVRGKLWSAHAVCNRLYTVYHTTPTKERLAALDALQGGRPRRYRFDAVTLRWLEESDLPRKHRTALGMLPWEEPLEAAEFEQLLDTYLPSLPAQCRKAIVEAAAVAAYHAQQEVPVADTLLCDDAPQWRRLTRQVALCWVHDGRHYKKLSPYLAHHRQLLDEFRERYWTYYRKLVAYRLAPSAEEAVSLSAEFDTLFSTTTGYNLLDERIAKTRQKKAELLRVLDDPTIPLHNNAAELAARRRVRKRDVSLAAGSPEGVRVWDTFQSLAETTGKLGVSFLQYLLDRLTQAGRIPRLAELITERSTAGAALPLAA